MDLYQLGKDIQAIHEKLDKLTGKKCGCSKGSQGTAAPHEVRISRAVLMQLIEQLHYLAGIASGKDPFTGTPTKNTWEGFLAKYNPKGLFDWCCRCDDEFGARHCFNINAASEADATASCTLQNVFNGGISVTKDKCDSSDHCNFGP